MRQQIDRAVLTLTLILGVLVLIGYAIQAAGPAFYWVLACVYILAIVGHLAAALVMHVRARTDRTVALPAVAFLGVAAAMTILGTLMIWRMPI